MFTEVFAIVATADMDRSLHFYRDLLEGEVTYRFPPQGSPGYVALRWGSSTLGVAHDPAATPPRSGPITLWVYAQDCDRAVDRLRSAGVRVTEEPADQPWGERVARVSDPDGNEVVIGAPSRPS